MKRYIALAFICIFGIIGWGLLTSFVWIAVLFGGKNGEASLAFNLFDEMWFEFFMYNIIFIAMIISVIILKDDKTEE